MSRKRRRKGVIALLGILIIVALLLYFFLFNNSDKSKVIDEMSDYEYTLEDRDTELLSENFKALKSELSKKDIDYEKYAEYLSKLFIIDLYTMSNKMNKYDVGGAEYVYPSHKENYQLKVEDTLYKYLEDHSGRNNSNLPTVTKISSEKIESTTYEYNANSYDAFKILLNWKYKKDLGYDESGIITLIKDKDKLFVVEYTPEVSQ